MSATPAGSERVDAGQATAMGRRQVRGSSLLVVGRVAAMFISLATQVIIVRALTKTDFGAFAYALTLASSARILLSLGQGKLLSRFLAKYEEEGDYNRMFGAIFVALGTIAATSTATIGALFVFSDALVGTAVDSEAAIRLVLILVLIAPIEALDQVFVSLFAVFSKPRAIFVRKYLLTPGLRLVVVLLLVALNADVTFLAIGYVVAGLVGILIYVALLVRVLRENQLLKEFRLRSVVLPFRAVFAFSFPLITGELALLSLNVGGVLIIGYYHSLDDVASFRAVFNSARLNIAVTSAFVTLFLPVAARLHARNDIAGLRHNYWHTAVIMAVLTFPIFALTGPLAQDTTVVLFGERYADSGAVLALLSIGYYSNAILGFNAFILQIFGRLRYLVGVNVLVVIVNIGVCYLLVPQFAAVGAAAANCAALLVQNVLNQLALRRCLGTGFVDRQYVRSYALIVGAAVALWAFQLLGLGLVAGLIAAVVTSLVVLVGTRRALELGDTFPELRRVPILRWVIR
jgi:O-antigen/teichoic acid export membrane protein